MKSFRERATSGTLRYFGNDKGFVEALRYVETGDPFILPALKPSVHHGQYWLHGFAGTINDPSAFDDEDRRAVELLLYLNELPSLASWLTRVLQREKLGEDFHGLVRLAARAFGASPLLVDTMTASFLPVLLRGGEPNSAGRYLLGLDKPELALAVKSASEIKDYPARFTGLLELLFACAPDRLDAIAPLVLGGGGTHAELADILLRKGKQRFEDLVADFWRKKCGVGERHRLSALLVGHNPARFREEALRVTRKDLPRLERNYQTGDIYVWLIETYGRAALDDITEHFRGKSLHPYWIGSIAEPLHAALGRDALPAFKALADHSNIGVRLIAAKHLVKARDGELDGLIRETLANGLKDALAGTTTYEDHRTTLIRLIADWNPGAFEDELFALSDHKTKAVREASARAVARIGEKAVLRVIPLLSDRKKDLRLWATVALTAVGTPAAAEALEARLDTEEDDDVRDAMLEVLDAARTARGHVVSREEIEGRAARSEKKLKTLPTKWLDLATLPPLSWSDGSPLGEQMTRYLLYRQSRAKEILPDIEARPLYSMIDRKAGAEFALALLRSYLSTNLAPADRWIFAVAALLGDDRVVPLLNRQAQDCADSSRGKMAEYGVHALALLGTDAALMIVDALALRYRTKIKNVGAAATDAFAAAAARRGVSVDELGDRVVPWLGFEPGKPRVVEAGGKAFEVTISPDWKLTFRDVEKNKKVASLPKSASKDVLDALKAEAAMLKDAVKGQKARLENLLVVQHRWPLSRWKELFLDHPILLPFAMRLVWGAYLHEGRLVGSFHALEDRSLTTAEDEPFDLAESADIALGMVHPLELDAETLQAWRTHLADYEIAPPFPQLDRPVISVKEDEREAKISAALRGTSLNALTFRGRAEKLGWARGSVNDGGSVDSYRKTFPAAMVDVFLGINGLYMGIGREDTITLEDYCFVRGGTVEVGGYTYDRPSEVTDRRLLPFGSVPPIVFSEVMADLAKISGKAVDPEGEAG